MRKQYIHCQSLETASKYDIIQLRKETNMYIGITVGLIGFLAIVIVIAIAISEEDFVAIITPAIFICICVIAIVFLVNSDGEPTNVKTTNVVAEKSVVNATVKWEGQPPSKGSKHKVNMTIVDPDGVLLKDHTFTVMYNGKKEFHLSIGVDESIVPFVNDKTDKVIVELEE